MNTVFPRKLWAITVNHLNHVNGLAIRKRITQDDLVLDPLQVIYHSPHDDCEELILGSFQDLEYAVKHFVTF